MNFRRFFRIFLWAGAISLTLLLGVSLYFYSVIRNIKEPLLAQFESYIDGKVQIGTAEAKFFPLGIELKNVELFAPGESEAAAKISAAEMRFNLFPLFQKKIQTILTVENPQVALIQPKRGPSNFEVIFKPLMSGTKREGSLLDNIWWKRLEVQKLIIRNANFVSREGSLATELKNISIEAEDIQFESKEKPARVELSFELPKISSKPFAMQSEIVLDEGLKKLAFQKGHFTWQPLDVNFHGEADLSDPKQNIPLRLQFNSKTFELSELAKNLRQALPASGKVQVQGLVTGSAFAPELDLKLSSPALTASGKTLSNFQASFRKSGDNILIKDSSFGIFGGSIGASGTVNTAKSSAQLNTNFKSLSLASISGKPDNSARLSGKMNLNIPNYKNPQNFSGSGPISVGPFPIPSVNLKDKIQIAQVLTSGTGLQRLVNLNMLSSSSNLTGTQIPNVNAEVRINNQNISFAPFQLSNDRIAASGSGSILGQKTIQASGTATLNSGVTSQLLPDARFRSYLTNGKNALSVPFKISGPLENPQFEIDSQYLQNLFAKAAAAGLTNILAEGINPEQMLNSALKQTPLGDPKNPLNQILGGSPLAEPRQPRNLRNNQDPRLRNNTQRQQREESPQNRQQKSVTGSREVDRLLFGR